LIRDLNRFFSFATGVVYRSYRTSVIRSKTANQKRVVDLPNGDDGLDLKYSHWVCE